MKILKITLKTPNLLETIRFYQKVLELPVVREWEDGVTFQVGKSLLSFIEEPSISTFYHVAFRTTTVHFDMMYEKLSHLDILLENEAGETSMFWKGKQLYFLDPNGNVFEILERSNLDTEKLDMFYDICEIGLPTENIERMKDFLQMVPNQYASTSEFFQFFGDESGVFVLSKKGRHWYPTERDSQIDPIVMEIEGAIEQVLHHPSYPYTVKIKEKWNERLPVHQLRIARPTDKWEEVNSFYGDEGLGLRRIGGFNKNGYEGVMYGLPSFGVHLEFTRHVNGSPCPAPTEDNLLVLYLSDHEKIDEMIERLNKLGAYEVPPVNPYWDKQAHTFEDPDGWRVVLCHSSESLYQYLLFSEYNYYLSSLWNCTFSEACLRVLIERSIHIYS
ncbi:hypothetical protein BC6307_08985 [Sutcliffiella cohnii]|uniref:VOC domain-containing protein n=1 Tax=Sutcliffiella cohnii TaxID=33932 RepID=A0A223KPS7_9BACI|nr:hypothetical protein BC6307_08985 [Sutcliffiella cohnii]